MKKTESKSARGVFLRFLWFFWEESVLRDCGKGGEGVNWEPSCKRMCGHGGRKTVKQTEKSQKELWQAVKFTLFSVSAGVIQIGTYTLFYEGFHWAPWLSYLVSLVLSVLWNFTFNRKYTFRSDADVKRSMLLVALFYAVFTPLSTWWTAALTGENPFTGAQASQAPLVNNYLVQIGTMLINFVTEFIYQKFVVYRGSIDTNEVARKAERKDR